MNSALEMLQRLADAPGPSGFEDPVVAVAREYAAEIGPMEEDCLRNLYIHRKENKGNRPVIMLDAHSDEVGFMVHSIKPNGTLRFVQIGRWNKSGLVAAKVLVRNTLGEYIPGIIAAKPVHFMTEAERANPNLDPQGMVIDIGATSAQEAEEVFHIRMGEPVVPAATFSYDEKRGIMLGKAFDCRIGCAAMLEVLRRLEGKELPCDVVAVLSSQEEVGGRGCHVAVNHVNPAAAIVMEGCPADDTFTEPYAVQTAMKKGPMFRFMDVSCITNPRFQRYTLDLAHEKGLPIQYSVREGGGTNASVINISGKGVPAVVAGVPVRYIHATHCMASEFDLEATVNMTIAMLESLTPEQIAKF